METSLRRAISKRFVSRVTKGKKGWSCTCDYHNEERVIKPQDLCQGDWNGDILMLGVIHHSDRIYTVIGKRFLPMGHFQIFSNDFEIFNGQFS